MACKYKRSKMIYKCENGYAIDEDLEITFWQDLKILTNNELDDILKNCKKTECYDEGKLVKVMYDILQEKINRRKQKLKKIIKNQEI
jgi:hypothetical protein